MPSTRKGQRACFTLNTRQQCKRETKRHYALYATAAFFFLFYFDLTLLHEPQVPSLLELPTENFVSILYLSP